MAVTIKDIAKAADVSPSTVSRVIAENPRISGETSRRVKKIMQEMNYHPNFLARSLASKTTKIVGTLIPGSTEKALQHPFFAEVLRGVTSKAYKFGYNILISSAETEREEKELIGEYAKSGITEGIILMTSRKKDAVIKELSEISFPFVLVGTPESGYDVNYVDNDNVEAGYKITKHLISRGHKRIAFIGVSDQYLVLRDRFEGYQKALAENGIKPDEALTVSGVFMSGGGAELTRKLLSRRKAFSGLIAADDFMAFEAMKVLKENGLNVPGDVAVAGFNNVQLSSYFSPSLTSVDINAFTLGEKAFEMIFNSLENPEQTPSNAKVGTNVIIRESTGSFK